MIGTERTPHGSGGMVATHSRVVNTRRGMPSRPVRCIGTKVAVKPRNMSQNAQAPKRSESMRPVSSGK
jgi:hypothetical protein